QCTSEIEITCHGGGDDSRITDDGEARNRSDRLLGIHRSSATSQKHKTGLSRLLPHSRRAPSLGHVVERAEAASGARSMFNAVPADDDLSCSGIVGQA